MTTRYRKTDWQRLRRAMPPPIAARIAASPDPPGFVAVRFGDEAAQHWVEERLGRGFRVVLVGDDTTATTSPQFARHLSPLVANGPPKRPT